MTMTPDDRAQLVEDIQRSATFRFHVVEQAKSDRAFDIAAAWEELDALDKSINARIAKARVR
jgi:hypothetical protein